MSDPEIDTINVLVDELQASVDSNIDGAGEGAKKSAAPAKAELELLRIFLQDIHRIANSVERPL